MWQENVHRCKQIQLFLLGRWYPRRHRALCSSCPGILPWSIHFWKDDKQKGKHFWNFQYFEVILTPVDCIGFICNRTEEEGMWCGWCPWWEIKPSVFDYNLCGACSMKCITMDSCNSCRNHYVHKRISFHSCPFFFYLKQPDTEFLFYRRLHVCTLRFIFQSHLFGPNLLFLL